MRHPHRDGPRSRDLADLTRLGVAPLKGRVVNPNVHHGPGSALTPGTARVRAGVEGHLHQGIRPLGGQGITLALTALPDLTLGIPLRHLALKGSEPGQDGRPVCGGEPPGEPKGTIGVHPVGEAPVDVGPALPFLLIECRRAHPGALPPKLNPRLMLGHLYQVRL